MTTKFWFKRKRYGWGWYPATWEGWLVLCVVVGLIVADFFRIDATSHSASDTLMSLFVDTLAIITLLIIICYKKGETPRWQWGDKVGKDDSLHVS